MSELEIDSGCGAFVPAEGFLTNEDSQSFKKISEDFFFTARQKCVHHISNKFACRVNVFGAEQVRVLFEQIRQFQPAHAIQATLVKNSDIVIDVFFYPPKVEIVHCLLMFCRWILVEVDLEITQYIRG